MLVVGLTGGIGSGKTTVAGRLAEHGAVVIDADEVAREVVEPGRPALEAIRERFGAEVVDELGRLDRARLAGIVFDDEQAREDVEAITHPRIREVIDQRLEELAAEQPASGRDRVVVLDHPLLVETGRAEELEVVVVVLAPGAARRHRLIAGRGMDMADIEARMASQVTDERRREVATHVIDNNGSMDQLHEQVDALWEELATRAERSP